VPGMPASGPSAMEILRQRFARGEIDTATFEQMRERLEASGTRDN
jgi:putative membrane protein